LLIGLRRQRARQSARYRSPPQPAAELSVMLQKSRIKRENRRAMTSYRIEST
jgi:hypothetical protein